MLQRSARSLPEALPLWNYGEYCAAREYLSSPAPALTVSADSAAVVPPVFFCTGIFFYRLTVVRCRLRRFLYDGLLPRHSFRCCCRRLYWHLFCLFRSHCHIHARLRQGSLGLLLSCYRLSGRIFESQQFQNLTVDCGGLLYVSALYQPCSIFVRLSPVSAIPAVS